MNTIIHDPTRGWLLLTEKWPIAPTQHSTGEYDTVEVSDYRIAINHCLSTAIEIAKEDWDEVNRITDCTKPKCVIIPNHKPFSVDAEFEVKWQILNVHDKWVDIDHTPEDTNPDTAWPQNRQIARLVKAKEVDPSKVIVKPPVMIYEHKSEPEPTESQDELWRELDMKYVKMSPWDDPVLDINEARKRFRIERI